MNKKRTEKTTPFKYYDYGINSSNEGKKKDKILNNIALSIGWIIIEFNSLESQINFQIKEQLSRSEGQDEIVYTYLSKMPMGEKIELLMKLYGIWVFKDYELKNFREPLKLLESKLKLASTNRNKYAHTNWSDMYENRIFKVKTQSKKDGVYHTFMRFEEEHLEEDLELIQNLQNELWEFDQEFNSYMLCHSERRLIFSYGSNMFNPRLKNRVPSAEVLGIGKLSGYILEFSKASKDGSGKATIVETKEKKDVVWGTLSVIEKSEKPLLDKVEGLNKGYVERHAQISTETEEQLLASFYVAEESAKNLTLKPYCWYKKLLVEGAKLNNLPGEYIKALEAKECIEDADEKREKKELSILEIEKSDNTVGNGNAS